MAEGGPLYLHVGLPKTGTTYLQALLAGNRPALREAGFVYPFVRPAGMFHGAVEVRGQYRLWGLDPAVVRGTWAQLCGRARAFPGTAIISHEILGGATPQQIRAALQEVAGMQLHVVLTARDPGRQVTAHWQEQVKNGQRYSFAEFAGELRARGRDAGAGGFWAQQDLLDTLDRWGAVVPAERLHVVVCPRTGAPPTELWRRFAAAVGLDPGVLDPSRASSGNPSLGAPQVALLRAVNEALAGRLQQPRYAYRVKRYFAQQVLAEAAAAAPRPVAPAELHPELSALGRSWADAVAGGGYHVHGDPEELLPAAPDPTSPHPDDVPATAAPPELAAVLARMLVDMEELAEAPAQRPGPVRDPGAGSGPGPRARRLLARLRHRRGPAPHRQ